MKNREGITEAYWASLTEDQRFFWKIFTRTIALLAAWFVLKTGCKGFDWFASAFAALVPTLVIESQRSCRKFSSKIRKAIVRIIVFLGSWGIAFLGIAYIAQAAIFAIVTTFSTEVIPSIQRSKSDLFALLIISVSVVASLVAIIRVVRQLQFEDLIFRVPREQISRLLVQRKFVANTLPLFAYFELSTLLAGFAYASLAAVLAKPFFLILSS